MRIRTSLLFLSLSVLALLPAQPERVMGVFAVGGLHAAPARNWEEDLRRCLVRKRFDGGSISISTTDGSLDVWVRWDDDTGLDDLKETEVRVTIGQHRLVVHPQTSDAGGSGYELGPLATVAPLLSKGRWLTLAFPAHPERDLRVPIGDGKRAVNFLSRCRDFWTKWRRRHP